jgi:hypothetical protein
MTGSAGALTIKARAQKHREYWAMNGHLDCATSTLSTKINGETIRPVHGFERLHGPGRPTSAGLPLPAAIARLWKG